MAFAKGEILGMRLRLIAYAPGFRGPLIAGHENHFSSRVPSAATAELRGIFFFLLNRKAGKNREEDPPWILSSFLFLPARPVQFLRSPRDRRRGHPFPL